MALLEFYGETCPHCVEMMPIIDKLIAEGVAIEKLEVWNNEENAKKMNEVNQNRCPGVPFFLNTKSDQWICGGTDEATLRLWAAGEKIQN
ncbi:hypothetical protein COV06_01050 [Candidatus Uhrbacteria bacterium CG10_big_fil_rev_8_21_14_0_10_50_16]|uniref:Thioredoxin domain-containing protein n=1 Tax=Candidatus Uhrbacteria bacterium CG10_big_fil_rev_8_21_14_0_10_50_16 TaxID=1975039 RepID=A0A2H0RN44_9BACT|nr:MAG: hypothetical protein COV06_01050 [Candidatus Uhrbacteria bacterium CG10_big_fil_rev_8_21_14_0_10_50_16]